MRNSNCFYLDLFLSKRSTERWFLITRIYHILKQNNNNFESGNILIKTATIPSKTKEILGAKQASSDPVIPAPISMLCVSKQASSDPVISAHISMLCVRTACRFTIPGKVLRKRYRTYFENSLKNLESF